MSKILSSLLLACSLLKAYPQSGYSIRPRLKPYTGGKVYLGYYYGKIRALADSAQLNAGGEAVFSGKDRLTGGGYFVVSPNRAVLFELLLDSNQHFSVAADTTNLPGSVTFTGSSENLVFQGYTQFTAAKGKEITAQQKELGTAHTRAD